MTTRAGDHQSRKQSWAPRTGAGAMILHAAVASAETRTYSYNARGEFIGSIVSGGPASGVSSAITYDSGGNRTGYKVSGSKSSPAYHSTITVPLNGMTQIVAPQ